MIERWEDAMLRLNVLALFPEFARAFASVVIQLSHVVGGLGSQSKIALPAKPPATSCWKGKSLGRSMFHSLL